MEDGNIGRLPSPDNAILPATSMQMNRPSTWFERLVLLLWSAVALVVGLMVFFGTVAGLDTLAAAVWPRAFTPDHAHVLSTGMLVVMLVYWMGAVVLGGFVAGALGRKAPRLHAAALGVVLACFFGINLMRSLHGPDPVWWHAATLALVLPASFVGGGIYAMRKARREHPEVWP